MRKSSRPFPLVPAVVSLAGLFFCLWVFLTGGDSLCLTSGCLLFQDFRLAGVSLWHGGITLFSLLLVLALMRFVHAALLCAGAALVADTALLAVMLFTAPCVNCLLVALFIALSFLAFRREMPDGSCRERSGLVLVWSVTFLFNLSGVIRDLAEPWTPVPAREQAAVQIYFSPSCRACQVLLENADKLADARWYPVSEDTRDILVIAVMTEKLTQGLPLRRAVEEAQKTVPSPADFEKSSLARAELLRPDMLLLQFRLWKNHAHVLSAGSDRLPFVEFLGLPSFLHDAQSPPQRGDVHGAEEPFALPEISGLDVTGFCRGTGDAPCEAPESPGAENGLIDTSGMLP